MATIMPSPYLQFFDDNGDPLALGTVDTYAAGTVSTPKATFTDANSGIPLSNPVVLDSAGRAVIFINGAYKFVVKDSLGNIIRTVDNITAGGLLADGDYGDITVSSSGTIMTIDAGAVTTSKLASQAAKTIIANATAGTASPTAVSASTVLDFIGTPVQGDILFRGSSSWNYLAPGTAGQVLTTQGAAADPTWSGAGGTATPVSFSSVNNVVITVDLTTYSTYKLYVYTAAMGANWTIEASSNGGGVYATTTYSFKSIATTTVANQAAAFMIADGGSEAGVAIDITQPSLTGHASFQANGGSANTTTWGSGVFGLSAAANRIRINFTSSTTGFYTLIPVARR